MNTTVLAAPRPRRSDWLRQPLEAPPRCEPMIYAQGINWRGGAGGRPLVLELTFHNPHAEPTRRTQATLRQAEFGAFQAWRPVGHLEVPAIEPGGSITLALGGTLTRHVDMDQLGRWAHEVRRGARLAGAVPLHEAVHFVGNLDLLIGSQRSVERHWGHLAGLRPGCRNVAFFKVGDGRRDVYTFRVADRESTWEVVLATQGRADLEEGAPLSITRDVIQVGITPPAYATTGNVVVVAHRSSTDELGVVEFTLDRGEPYHRMDPR